MAELRDPNPEDVVECPACGVKVGRKVFYDKELLRKRKGGLTFLHSSSAPELECPQGHRIDTPAPAPAPAPVAHG